jgi:hypothetical protein
MMQFSAGDSRVIGGTTYVRDETGNWHAQGGAQPPRQADSCL